MKRIEKNQISTDKYQSIFSISHPQSEDLFYQSENLIDDFFDKVEEIKKTINIPSGIVEIEPIDNSGLLRITILKNKIDQKQIDVFAGEVEKLLNAE